MIDSTGFAGSPITTFCPGCDLWTVQHDKGHCLWCGTPTMPAAIEKARLAAMTPRERLEERCVAREASREAGRALREQTRAARLSAATARRIAGRGRQAMLRAEIHRLRAEDGLTWDEIAAAVGMPASTARYRYFGRTVSGGR